MAKGMRVDVRQTQAFTPCAQDVFHRPRAQALLPLGNEQRRNIIGTALLTILLQVLQGLHIHEEFAFLVALADDPAHTKDACGPTCASDLDPDRIFV